MVSIITPSFNRERYVAETLDSILAQTYKNWENIIVDDGSTDSTKDIIREYAAKDSRIKLYERERDPKGACTCRNQGVDICSGKYLIFLDTDDLLEPFCLEQRVRAIESVPELDFAIFPSLMFRHKPNDLGLWWNIDKDEDELTRQFHQDAICQGTGVIWKKSSFNKLGQWDVDLKLWQDIDLFFRAYIQGCKYRKFFDLPPDLHNRRLESSLSRSDFFSRKKTLSRIDVVKRAVRLLKENNKTSYLTEAKYMVAEIASGLVRSGESELASNLNKWAGEQDVLSDKEYNRLRWMILLYRTRLARLPMMKNLVTRLESSFYIESTLGILPHTLE